MDIVFTWDPQKAASNLEKHDVSFEEAMTVFAHPLAWIFPDEWHSQDEPRELIIGTSAHNRLLVVSFTQRGEVFRIISARPADRRERRTHEEEHGS